MSNKPAKRSKVLNFVLLGLMALLAAMTAVVLAGTAGKGMIPAGYAIFVLIISAAIIIISLFSFKKKAFNIVMIVISAVACFVMIALATFTNKLNSTISDITAKTQDVNMIKVAVLKESPYQIIGDLKGKTISYSDSEDKTIVNRSIEEINGKVSDVSYTASSGLINLADELRDGDTDAIIINNASLSILDDIDAYSNFTDEIRFIYEFEIRTDVDISNDTLGDVFTIYISGIDTYGSPSATSRSDVNILAVVNRKSKHIQLINTPRDAYVYLPNSGDMKDKLTHAGIYGIETSMKTISNLYDINVDTYMRVNFTGFQEIIDAIGGIDVYSDYDFTVTGGGFSYKKGMNHMNGIEALAFARERKAFAEGDNQRGIDQMKVIDATISKLTSSPEALTNYNSLLSGLASSMQTSVPNGTIYSLVNDQLTSSGSWKVDSYAVTGEGTYASTYSMPGTQLYVMIPDEDSIQEAKDLIQKVKNES